MARHQGHQQIQEKPHQHWMAHLGQPHWKTHCSFMHIPCRPTSSIPTKIRDKVTKRTTQTPRSPFPRDGEATAALTTAFNTASKHLCTCVRKSTQTTSSWSITWTIKSNSNLKDVFSHNRDGRDLTMWTQRIGDISLTFNGLLTSSFFLHWTTPPILTSCGMIVSKRSGTLSGGLTTKPTKVATTGPSSTHGKPRVPTLELTCATATTAQTAITAPAFDLLDYDDNIDGTMNIGTSTTTRRRTTAPGNSGISYSTTCANWDARIHFGLAISTICWPGSNKRFKASNHNNNKLASPPGVAGCATAPTELGNGLDEANSQPSWPTSPNPTARSFTPTSSLIEFTAIGKPFGHNLPRRTFNNKLS